jgi:hypothetical protein
LDAYRRIPHDSHIDVTQLRAVIQVDDPESVTLIYQYQNQPLADAMKTMHMHYGTAMLRESLTAAA